MITITIMIMSTIAIGIQTTIPMGHFSTARSKARRDRDVQDYVEVFPSLPQAQMLGGEEKVLGLLTIVDVVFRNI